uniref:Uncharacterized protein n=1 Tax=Moumouvirus sp. 'Monve' TaxID=1128131 RepID=H2EEK3_9VIRU|nr:hypothetical protein mv_R621 [Moumouvirus Monve]
MNLFNINILASLLILNKKLILFKINILFNILINYGKTIGEIQK